MSMKKKPSRSSLEARLFKTELAAYRKMLASFDTARALTCEILIRYEEWDQLVELSVNPLHYDDPMSFFLDYQATGLMQKSPRIPTTYDREGVALSKFRVAEQQCLQTNLRVQEFFENPHNADPWILKLVYNIQQEIRGILGKLTAEKLSYAYDHMRFGPGATVSLKGIVSQGKKYSYRTLATTKNLVHLRAFCFPELWKENVRDLTIVEYSKLTTVPKNAKTNRCIAIEPDLNIFYQLGVGALLRRQLMRVGLDLSDQTVNQTWASVAHNLDLATVDLSSASDTISKNVVQLLLPPEWVELLAFGRTPMTKLGDELIELEKWSSMGNGYTFELETLIFYAVARCVTHASLRTAVSCYGDDIIIPADALPNLMRALDFLGFSVNKEKTFGKGRFHESCGMDFFDGVNVRPVFFRADKDFHDVESVVFQYANNLRRLANRLNGGLSCDIRLLPAWLTLYTSVEKKHRYSIPEGFGDGGFVQDLDQARPATARRKYPGWCGFWFPYRAIRAYKRCVDVQGFYFSVLNGNPSNFTGSREALRNRYIAPAKKIGYVLQWPNLGPWSA